MAIKFISVRLISIGEAIRIAWRAIFSRFLLSRLAKISFHRQIFLKRFQDKTRKHMSNEAKLELEGKAYTLPTLVGTEGE